MNEGLPQDHIELSSWDDPNFNETPHLSLASEQVQDTGILPSDNKSESGIEADITINPDKAVEFGLTEREQEVLKELAGGASYREIGEALDIKASTINSYLSSLYGKLGVSDKISAIIAAGELEIIVLPQLELPKQEDLNNLTRREFQVFKALANGCRTSPEIEQVLGLNKGGGVDLHIINLKAKVRAKNRLDLVRIARALKPVLDEMPEPTARKKATNLVVKSSVVVSKIDEDLDSNKNETESEEDASVKEQPNTLTPWEGELLKFVARGLSSPEIAKLVYAEEQTIKYHLSNAYRKLGARNRIEAVNKAGLVGAIKSPEDSEEKISNPLTLREQESMHLLAEGFTNRQIAECLGVTEKTIKFHLSNAYRKLNVRNRQEATFVAPERLQDIAVDEVGEEAAVLDFKTLSEQFERERAAKEREHIRNGIRMKVAKTITLFEHAEVLPNPEKTPGNHAVIELTNRRMLRILKESGFISEEMEASQKVDLKAALAAMLIQNPATRNIVLGIHSELARGVIEQEAAQYFEPKAA